MSNQFVTTGIDVQKMVDDCREKSQSRGEGMVMHYHSAQVPCGASLHRFFYGGEEVTQEAADLWEKQKLEDMQWLA